MGCCCFCLFFFFLFFSLLSVVVVHLRACFGLLVVSTTLRLSPRVPVWCGVADDDAERPSFDLRTMTCKLLIELEDHDRALEVVDALLLEDDTCLELYYLAALCYAYDRLPENSEAGRGGGQGKGGERCRLLEGCLWFEGKGTTILHVSLSNADFNLI